MVAEVEASENPSLQFRVAVEWAKNALEDVAIPDDRLRNLHPIVIPVRRKKERKGNMAWGIARLAEIFR